MCFYLKVSRVHVFSSDFIRVCMLCDEDRSTLVSKSTRPGGFPSQTIIDNLTKYSKLKIYY